MVKQRIIRDPVWGNILLSDDKFKNVIDTNPIQRLRYIRQGGFTFLSIPSANHSRFEHILGTYYLSRKWQNDLNRSGHKLLFLALLHHIDETPFSYATAEVVEQIRKDVWGSKYDVNYRIFINKIIELIKPYGEDYVELADDFISKKNYNFYSIKNRNIDFHILLLTSMIDAICRNSHYMGIGRPSSIDTLSKFFNDVGGRKNFGMTFKKDIFVMNCLEELKSYALINVISHAASVKSTL